MIEWEVGGLEDGRVGGWDGEMSRGTRWMVRWLSGGGMVRW